MDNPPDFVQQLINLQQKMSTSIKVLDETNTKYQFYQIYLLIHSYFNLYLQNSPCNASHQKLLDDFFPTLEEMRRVLEEGDLLKLDNLLYEFEEYDVSDHKQPCQDHWSNLIHLINQFRPLIKEQLQKDRAQDFSSMNIELIHRELINPLSNQKRLEILIAVHEGHQRFKDLENALNLQAGHLLYHLNPLKESGYITQDNQKNYFLSEKGRAILGTLKQVSDRFY